MSMQIAVKYFKIEFLVKCQCIGTLGFVHPVSTMPCTKTNTNKIYLNGVAEAAKILQMASVKPRKPVAQMGTVRFGHDADRHE